MENTIYDQYASAALKALIMKLPMLDRQGELGIHKTDEEIHEIKKEICRSAHDYASLMVQTRAEFVDYLKSIDINV